MSSRLWALGVARDGSILWDSLPVVPNGLGGEMGEHSQAIAMHAISGGQLCELSRVCEQWVGALGRGCGRAGV